MKSIKFTVIFFFIIQGSALCNDFNDTIVMKLILTSLAVSFDDNSNLADLIDNQYNMATIENAWHELKDCRDAGNSEDLNIAAAEHYLFARLLASEYGDTNLSYMPKWYETLKNIAYKFNIQTFIQASDQPTSPTNINVTHWGEKGITKGLIDYTERTGMAASSKGYAIAQSITFVSYLYYSKYYNEQSNSICRSNIEKVFKQKPAVIPSKPVKNLGISS
ncbi:MAG: hypothetical protein KKC46_00200 [Proteobacteria bacterium]|nr:hypothetical protein [Pseudomonadota bacterium]